MKTKIVIATAAVGAVLAATIAGPAFAVTNSPTHTPKTLASVQAAAVTATTKRISALKTAMTATTANRYLTAADKASIMATYSADLSGETALAARIAADTSVSVASADLRGVALTYRVFAVALPQGRIAATADRASGTAIAHLTAAESQLGALLAGKDAAKSTAALQADLTDLKAQIAAITTSANGLAAAALAVTPSGYNADHSVLTADRASSTAIHTAEKKAATDVASIRTAIRTTHK